MKKITFNWKIFLDYKSNYYIAILIFIDFFSSIPYLNYEKLVLFPHAGPGVFELWLLMISLLHKSKLISALAYIFAFIKPLIAICIIKKKYVMYYFAIAIYTVELLAAMCFIVTFRIPETGLSLLFFVECGMAVFFLSIIILLTKTIRREYENGAKPLKKSK